MVILIFFFLKDGIKRHVKLPSRQRDELSNLRKTSIVKLIVAYLMLYLINISGNHSCDPNAEISFVHGDHTMTLMALKDIMPEEVIK